MAYLFPIKVVIFSLYWLQNVSFLWNLFSKCFNLCSAWYRYCSLTVLLHHFWRAKATHNEWKPFFLFYSLSLEISCIPNNYHSLVLCFDREWPTCLHKILVVWMNFLDSDPVILLHVIVFSHYFFDQCSPQYTNQILLYKYKLHS